MEKKKICILVSPEEYELITLNANSVKMSLSGYVRRVSLDRLIVHNNYQAIMESTREIRQVRREVQTIVSCAVKSGKIYRADLQAVCDRLSEIEDLERKMLHGTERERKYNRKLIRELLKKEINNNE